MFEVELTPAADAELRRAFNTHRRKQPSQASHWLRRMLAAAQTLRTNPERCGRAAQADTTGRDVRELLIGRNSACTASSSPSTPARSGCGTSAGRRSARSPKTSSNPMLIYPAIDVRGGRCVRLRQGDFAQETVFSDDPAAIARRWVAEGADRLHVVDLDGAKAGRPVNGEVVRAICAAGVPVQLGGGLRTDDDLATAFGWGVRWAVLGTKALQSPDWVRATADRHPGRIVLGVDARDGFVATDGWLSTSTTPALDLIRQVDSSPLFAVVYTDIATDGMMGGPNYPALAGVRANTRLPVVASGGVSSLDHARRLAEGGTFGCIVGRALYDGQVTLPDLLSLTPTT